MKRPDLSGLPSISSLLEDPRLRDVPHEVAVRAAREVVDETREAVLTGGALPDRIDDRVVDRVARLRQLHLRRVINATGIVLHTNLGRAPLAAEAARAVSEVARGYCNVEMDLASGERGERLAGIRPLLAQVTGAPAALAVNNNAAAVLLVLTALARGREVIVSRGELVEIGGSFRVPDVIAAGGAELVEVGTTNRTRVADYARAITDRTAVLLRVHPSNFRMLGFTERPDRAGLAALARQRGILLVEDLGSGLLGTHAGLLQAEEPDAVDCALGQGVDLACFSGDKLLGGPQAGIVAGRVDLVAALRGHPMYRALRLDKLVLAALEATLRLFAEGRGDEVPARSMLSLDRAACRARAEQIAARIPGARVEDDVGFSGGGALPAVELPTAVVVVEVVDPTAFAAELRRADPPVIARVARDCLLIDPRTLLGDDADSVISAVEAVLAAGRRPG